MIDVNVKFGHWPYRPVKQRDDYVRAMQELEIHHAIVSSLSAVHYFNPQDGNDELERELRTCDAPLTPIAVIRPTLTNWRDDLMRCIDDYEMRGCILHPLYHGFALDGPEVADLMETVADYALPLFVQMGIEDPRRQYNRPILEPLSGTAIGAFARRYPDNAIVALGMKLGQPEQVGEPWPENLYFDISNYEHMGILEEACEKFGSHRLLFGTHFPIFNARANAEKLAKAELTESDRSAIAEGNARRLIPGFI